MFGRATIRLGIGPHSSSFFLLLLLFPRLISAVGDWMFTILRHMVWPWYGKRCDSMVLLIFQYYAKRLAGKNVSEMTIFCVEWVVNREN